MENLLSDNRKLKICHQKILLVLAVIAIIASALHFWPFESKPLWKLANVANISIVLGSLLAVSFFVFQKDRTKNTLLFPPLSIWAYLLFHLLSSAYADTFSRPALYTAKVSLVMICGYLLFAEAFRGSKRKYMSWSIILVCFICVISALYTQYLQKRPDCGFFENAYKYGTYAGIVGSFAVVYLCLGRSFRQYGLVLCLLLGLALTFRNIGGVVGVLSGLVTGLIICKERPQRIVLCAAILSFIVTALFFNAGLIQDFKKIENDGKNLRQRYIEWQAELNMLEKYGVTGSGAGSINDYRSNYYYRLPKLNTLQPFDQNGWLTVPAEIGIMGLICFVWILYEHGKYLFGARSHSSSNILRINTSLSAAFVACCVCNLFSSVHYNGVLISFVLVLALSKSVYHLTGKDSA